MSKNIFCASNPVRLTDALWAVLTDGVRSDFSGDIIFLPSRRAVRSVEKMLAKNHANKPVLLPRLIALGEGTDDEEIAPTQDLPVGEADKQIYPAPKGGRESPVSDIERTLVLAKMLTVQMGAGFAAALPIARDLVRMMNYLENEGKGKEEINWSSLVGDKYARHFQDKARFLDLAFRALPLVFPGRVTRAQKRNRDIRSWIDYLKNTKFARVIVCGSTGSVPATADLMEYIAGLDNGYIILPGKISECGKWKVECGISHPYYSEIEFLERIEARFEDMGIIDTDESAISFFNSAFSNQSDNSTFHIPHSTFVRIDCAREAEEAEVVAEIALDALGDGKSVLVVTPDAAVNQRLRESFARRGILVDFSDGMSGGTTQLGRAILGLIDARIRDKAAKREPDGEDIYVEYKQSNLFNAVQNAAIGRVLDLAPCDLIGDESVAVWDAIRELSDVLQSNGIELSPADLRAVIADALSRVSVRPPMMENARVTVLGTIESRMQMADVVILTGLNEGMFPARGFENPWLPQRVADAIGLPPPERKVSLMALDFITLSCASQVYWTRSKMSGGNETTESRFLSRVAVAASSIGGVMIDNGEQWLARARMHDSMALTPLDYSAPTPPADWSPVHVTTLELLLHNPYAFYARHILGLRHDPDPWENTTAIDFGNLVHDAIEELAKSQEPRANDDIVKLLEEKAQEKLESGSVLFHFWRKRFVGMAPHVREFLEEAKGAEWHATEEGARGKIDIGGREVRAKADLVYIKEQIGYVTDIKTGKVPTEKQLNDGMMPQLPLEALMMQNGAFTGQPFVPVRVIMKFLRLQRGNCAIIEYANDDLVAKVNAARENIEKYFNRYNVGAVPYEYRKTSEEKYKAYDDLARAND